jgi:fructose-bisphosphate aldolase, class I
MDADEFAGRTLVLFSGGEMQGEGSVIDKARIGMESGATGLIFGRNIWQRPFDEALALANQILDMMRDYGA